MLIAAFVVLAYALVTAVLMVLSYQAKAQISRHELLRQTRMRRLQYELTLLQRQKDLDANMDVDMDVDILDDAVAEIAGEIGPEQTQQRAA